MNQDELDNEREASRNLMIDAWKKHKANETLEPLEEQIASIIKDHPEYHAAFEQTEHLEVDYPLDPTINPYLHIGLHLTILEQISLDRPQGIRKIYQTLTTQIGNQHEAEHLMIQVLATCLESALNGPSGNAEQQYLDQLRAML